MKKKVSIPVFTIVVLSLFFPHCDSAKETVEKKHTVWRPLPSHYEGGLLAERIDLWRENRLWHMVNSGYLLSGFESRPGIHPWQGEHVGKWLHAATLAYEQTHDEKLGKTMKEIVTRLLATQESNGYLGTYAEDERFYAIPDDKRSWDIWSHRYNIYGLLTYERFHSDLKIVKACERMADLLIDTYGKGKADITQNGTRRGISSTTLLESIMMLYERTQKVRFFKFAKHIVECSELASGLHLMKTMLQNEDVSGPGDGKAYQLMANLLGYLLLYKHTGDNKYLLTVENGWENIRDQHMYITGGPWSRHMSYNGNTECFALPKDFAPGEAVIETCSNTTWIQLNLHLLELTGQAKYAVEAERAVLNALLAAQFDEGIDWCYFTKANQDFRPFQSEITCCASSGPRALEMFSYYLIGEVDGGIAFNSLFPCSVILSDSFGKSKILVSGNYPFNSEVVIRIEKSSDKKFGIEFRDPSDARLIFVRINGEDIHVKMNDRGFYRISRNWEKGDEIVIKFEYLLMSHVVTPGDDKSWIAFTYGPWALAQTVDKGADIIEPFDGKGIQHKSASEWFDPILYKEGEVPGFRIKDTEIVLGPYYLAGSKITGPRTYFKF